MKGRSALAIAFALAFGVLAWLYLRAPVDGRGTIRATDRDASEAPPSGDAADGLSGVDLSLDGGGEDRRLSTTAGLGVRLRGPGRLRGTVRDRGSGAGIPGVTVGLLSVPPAGADIAAQVSRFIGASSDFSVRVAPIAKVETDAEGHFAFEGVREGRWYLGPLAPHFVLDSPASARVIASGAGGPVDVWMRPGGRVVGRVVDSADRPVAGAEVALTTSSMGIMEAAADGEVAFLRQTADGDGRFAFPGVVPAEGYEIAAIGMGIAVTHVLDLEVKAGEDTVVEVRGQSGGRIRGRVFGAALGADSGESDPGGAPVPVARAKIGVVPRGLRHLKLAKAILLASHTTTDEDGSYLLEGVPPGAVDLLAMAEDYVPGRGPLVQVPGTPGVEVEARDFMLVRGPKVSGRVVDADGGPVAGARILWNVIDVASVEGQPSLAPILAAGMKEFEFPASDADGRFEAGPLGGDAPFALRALKSGFEVGRAEWRGPSDAQNVTIVLRRGGAVTGRIVDAITGEAVPSFTVSLSGRIEPDPAAPSRFNPFAGGTEVEDGDGRFRLQPVATGPQTLRVAAYGYLPCETPLEVAPAGEEFVDIVVRLTPGATLRGVVLDGSGAPIAGAQVTTEALVAGSFEELEGGRLAIESALAVKGRRRTSKPPVGLLRHLVALGVFREGVVSTDPDGVFELAGLEPGQVEVLGFHRDYKAGALVTVVEEGDASEPVTLTLTAGGGLRGKVTDRFGQPVSDAMVLAVSPGLAGGPTSNGEFHQARSRRDGSYEMLNMDGGPFMIVATRGDEHLSIMSFLGTLNFDLVNVPRERVITHNLVDTSASACRVTGIVTRGGVPVKGGLLLALNLESEGLLGLDFKAAPIENDGSYSFQGLSPGEYQVTFEGEGPQGRSLIDVPDAPQLVHDIALPEGVITGRFVAVDSGEPVAGLRVRLARGGGAEWSLADGISRGIAQGLAGGRRRARDGARRTGKDGSFRFTGLDEGRYRLQLVGDAVSAPYAPPADLVVSLDEDQRHHWGDIRLEPGQSIRGRVVDGEGAPIPSAEVLALAGAAGGSKSPQLPRRASTNEDGVFEVDGLRVGDWRLLPSAETFASSPARTVTIGEDGHADEVELVLQRGVEVEVLVLDGTGAARSGVACGLEPEGGERGAGGLSRPGSFLGGFFTGSSTTDGDGRLPLGRFGPGRYVLQASEGFSRAKKSVEIRTGTDQRLEIVLD